MEIRPIISAMLRNKTGAILVGLQIAITLAVLANAVFIIVQRAEKIGRPPGIDSDNLMFLESWGFGPAYDHKDTLRRDLDLIRAQPGVVAASSINGIPMSGGGASGRFFTEDNSDTDPGVPGNVYRIDEHGIDALGAKLIEGRMFNQSEVKYEVTGDNSFVPSVIITRDLARDLFGEGSALGKRVYSLRRPAVVVGVIDNMLSAWVGWDLWTTPTNVMFQPYQNNGPRVLYVVRAEPGRRDALMAEIDRKLSESNLNRAITWVRTHEYFIKESYQGDRSMIAYLTVIGVLMIAITALGIVGLASFHVNVRRKQIGTRRAVGARRIDIIRYFMVENWLLTTGGVVIGTVLAFAFGQWLSSAYALPRLQPVYVASGVLVLWILGQIAVFVPARRAAAIPPAIATRTV